MRSRSRRPRSERHLRRHRRGRHALGHRPGRWNVQVDRRRQDLDAHRSCGHPADRARSSSIRATRRRCSSRRSVIRTARTPSAACSVRATAAQPGSTCSARTVHTGAIDLALRARQSARHLCRAVADAAPAVERLSALERARQRFVQIERRRRHLDAGARQRVSRKDRPHRHCRRAKRSQTRLCNRRRQALADDVGGLYRSDDAGSHWKHISKDDRIWQRGWYFGRIAVDPKDANRIYAMNTIVLRSDDGGKHFVASRAIPPAMISTSCGSIPTTPSARSSASTRARSSRLNGGATWSSWYNQPTAQFYHVITDNRFPVLGVRRAAGFRRRGGAEPHRRLRRHQHAPVPRSHGRRRERQHRAGSRRSRHRLRRTRGQARPAHRPVADVDPTSPTPDDLYRAPGPCRSFSPSATPRDFISPTSNSSARSTAASTGRRSVRISRANRLKHRPILTR